MRENKVKRLQRSGGVPVGTTGSRMAPGVALR
jgi:hypothetical protein